MGCAGPNSLLLKAQNCESATPDQCEAEWAKWNKREEWLLRKQEWEARFYCEGDMIYYCGDAYCSGRPKMKPPRPVELSNSGCITQAQFDSLMRSMGIGRRY